MNKKTYQIIYGIVIILIFGILGASSVLGERKYKKKKNYSKSFYKKKSLRKSYYVPMLRNLPEGQVVDSKITHVEVYPSGALIERVGTVNLDSGEHRLVIPGLPNAIQAKSLYISGFSKDATAGSTFLESGTLVEFRPAELVKLEGELQALEEEEMELTSLEAALKSRKELMMLNFSKVDQQLLSNLYKRWVILSPIPTRFPPVTATVGIERGQTYPPFE